MKYKVGYEVKWRSKSKPKHSGEIRKVEVKHTKKSYTYNEYVRDRHGSMQRDKAGAYITAPKTTTYDSTDGWEYEVKWKDGTVSTKVGSRRLALVNDVLGDLKGQPKNKRIEVWFTLAEGHQIFEKAKDEGSGGIMGGQWTHFLETKLIKYPNFEFNAALRLTNRSNQWSNSTRVHELEILEGELDETPLMIGSKLSMHHELFEEMLMSANMVNGVLSGRWEFQKMRGKYSLCKVG